MRNKLPVHIEDRDLPMDKYVNNRRKNVSYGYVSVLSLTVTSMIITIASVITVIIFGK
jgi:hypothetical protein